MNKEKVVLVNDLSPGDVLIMSVAIRSLHKGYQNRFITDVRSPSNDIFHNSPYITPIAAKNPKEEKEVIEKLKKNENLPPIEIEDINGDKVKYIISHYPEIHRSGMTGLPFADGHRMFLEKQLNISIPRSGMKPDIFFSEAELNTPRIIKEPFWIINAGIKNDYTLKYYSHYQEVIDLLKGKVQFVQVGHSSHNHPPLKGVVDLRGKTNLRELFKLSRDADGAVCCVTMQMVIMAALSKPCVVVAGAREGTRWQLNPDHQFIYRTGVMKCATYDGCWKSKKEDCVFKAENDEPMCLELITPNEIARSVELYYLGGRINKEENNMENTIKLEDISIDEVKPVILDFDNPLTIYRNNELILEPSVFFKSDKNHNYATSTIFNTLRILKKYNPEDKYLEAYYWHYEKNKEQFMDSYYFIWWIGSNFAPRRILEIGSRTGVSICQLLSSILYYDKIEKIILCDNFSEIGSPEIILRNLNILNIPTDKVQFIIGDSTSEIPKFIEHNEKFDYILVDGCHDKPYAAADLRNALKLIDINGYIVMDDLSPDGCSLQDVWDNFVEENKSDMYSFSSISYGKGLGVVRRIK